MVRYQPSQAHAWRARGLVGHRFFLPLRCENTCWWEPGRSCRPLGLCPCRVWPVASTTSRGSPCSCHPPCILRGMMPGCPHLPSSIGVLQALSVGGGCLSQLPLDLWFLVSLTLHVSKVHVVPSLLAPSPAHVTNEAWAGVRGGGSEVCLGPGPPLLVWCSPAPGSLAQSAAPSRQEPPSPLALPLQPCSVSFNGATQESWVSKRPRNRGRIQSRQPPEWLGSALHLRVSRRG